MIYLGQYNWRDSGPTIPTQIWYEKYRSGTTMFYRFQVRMWLDSYSWYNDRIRGIHVLNGSTVHNALIKGDTSYNGWDVSIITPWFGVANKITGTTPYSLQIYDDNTGGGSKTFSFNLNIDSATPIISIYEVSRTHNSITLGYNSSGPTTPTSVQVNNGGTILGTYTGNPFTITGLIPSTTYSDIKAYGYSAAGWGAVSNSLSIKTYPSPVTISSTSVSNITPFTCTLGMTVSNSSDANTSEYSIYDSTGNTLILGPYTYTPAQWFASISNLNPETIYQVKFRVQTKESLVWSEYSTRNFSTLTDQAQGWFKINSVWVKGKLYIKVSNIWREVKNAYIKVNDTWKETTNN